MLREQGQVRKMSVSLRLVRIAATFLYIKSMTRPNTQPEQFHFNNMTLITSPSAGLVNTLNYQPTVTLLFVASFILQNLLQFNATGNFPHRNFFKPNGQ
jgi:hypothetical protein